MSENDNGLEIAHSVSGESPAVSNKVQSSAPPSEVISSEAGIPQNDGDSAVLSNEEKKNDESSGVPSNEEKASSHESNKAPSVVSETSKTSKHELPETDQPGTSIVDSSSSMIRDTVSVDGEKVPVTEILQAELQPMIEIDEHLNNNIEYIAEFQIREEEISKSHKKYVEDHPEIHSFLSDYLQLLLHKKPENVYQFTNEYFRAD
ncbi:hypothetical protein HDV01_006207 [Terramyces sp. JEL0728]|nr:hypothetical protein HDV01_006207 [Terramyces sp. JEL0728]